MGEIAGGVESLRVTAVDPFGNVASGYTGTVHVTSSDSQAVLPVDAALVRGVGTFPVTLKTAGTESISATDTLAGLTVASSSVVIAPASPVTLGVTSANQPSTSVVVTYSALDAFGNVATGYVNMVNIASTDKTDPLPTTAPLKNGVGSFVAGLTTQGSQRLSGNAV